MLEADIRRLDEQEPDPRLVGLESDIWVAIAARTTARRGIRTVALCQAAVMAIAMVGSITVGLVLATTSDSAIASVHLVTGMELAPSHLLFGTRQ